MRLRRAHATQKPTRTQRALRPPLVYGSGEGPPEVRGFLCLGNGSTHPLVPGAPADLCKRDHSAAETYRQTHISEGFAVCVFTQRIARGSGASIRRLPDEWFRSGFELASAHKISANKGVWFHHARPVEVAGSRTVYLAPAGSRKTGPNPGFCRVFSDFFWAIEVRWRATCRHPGRPACG